MALSIPTTEARSVAEKITLITINQGLRETYLLESYSCNPIYTYNTSENPQNEGIDFSFLIRKVLLEL